MSPHKFPQSGSHSLQIPDTTQDLALSIIARSFSLVSIVAVVLFVCPNAVAQDNYEIQVYGSETVEAGHTMVELHSNFTIDGTKAAPGSIYAADDAPAMFVSPFRRSRSARHRPAFAHPRLKPGAT